jgi:glutaredoxin
MGYLQVFTAPWCSSCSNQKSLLNDSDISYELIDVDQNQAKGQANNVRSLPTIIARDAEGNELDRTEGFTQEQALREMFDE